MPSWPPNIDNQWGTKVIMILPLSVCIALCFHVLLVTVATTTLGGGGGTPILQMKKVKETW